MLRANQEGESSARENERKLINFEWINCARLIVGFIVRGGGGGGGGSYARARVNNNANANAKSGSSANIMSRWPSA